MDTSRDALLSLLELQRVDSAIARLEARLGHLPEQAALEALEARLSELDEEIRRRRVALDEVATRQRRLDFEVDSLSQKIAGEVERLYSGKIGSPKELSDLSREVEALKRRKVVLEDNDLEVMEEREGAEKELNALLDERAGVAREIEEARVRRDTASGDALRRFWVSEVGDDRQVIAQIVGAEHALLRANLALQQVPRQAC